ncbi:MAG TPA: type 4a pilus biogenesis protein PilO [Gaiellaceae bacterium]|nr:type 4a pilus biogenesis protein PilO [Gaiellaceae bacterium]
MRSRLQSKNGLIAASFGGAVLVAAAMWFLAISPQRSKASKLDTQIAAVQAQIVERRTALASPSAQVHLRASDLYRLTKAMPDQTDMAGIILSLNRLAQARNLSFEAIQPMAPVAQTGFSVQPLNVSVQGRFSAVSSFLGDLRRLVNVRKKALVASGRLFSVDQVSFGQPDDNKNFPDVKAQLVVDAFTFVGGTFGAPTTPTTPSASSGTEAAGATP